MYISLQTTLVAGRLKWPAFAELAHKLGYPGTDVSLGEAMTPIGHIYIQAVRLFRSKKPIVGAIHGAAGGTLFGPERLDK